MEVTLVAYKQSHFLIITQEADFLDLNRLEDDKEVSLYILNNFL